MASAEWKIERLAARHDRTAFECGQAQLDDWLKQRSGQFDRRDLARTFVAVRAEVPQVHGYYALSNHHIGYESMSLEQARGLPRIDVPVILLGRLAVDRPMQGKGLGELLLVDALRRSLSVAEQIGVRAVEVDAIDESAQRFYIKHGFLALLDDPHHLFLPMQTIRNLKLPPL